MAQDQAWINLAAALARECGIAGWRGWRGSLDAMPLKRDGSSAAAALQGRFEYRLLFGQAGGGGSLAMVAGWPSWQAGREITAAWGVGFRCSAGGGIAGGKVMSIGRKRQERIYLAGLAGRRQCVPVSPEGLEQAALATLGRDGAAYFAGGAGLERTMAENREAFGRCRIVPRMMRDVSQRSLAVDLFGRTLPLPILLGPIGVLELAHRDADLPAARAASALGIPFVTSSQSSRPMERIAEAIGAGPRWFQLYWSARNELTASFVRRAEQAGYEAIVVTLDTTMLGWRTRDLEGGYLPFLRGRGIANYTSDPVFPHLPIEAERLAPPRPGLGALRSAAELLRAYPGGTASALAPRQTLAAIRRFLAIYSRPDLTWADLPFLRGQTRLPVLLKGILHPDDARRAVEAGVDGIIVSNHGGRQVDGAIAALDALPGVVDAVAGKVPVLFDSGIRTGADIFKALCLGAKAVLIGRPYIYGLALAGEQGVREVIENLAAELDLTLGLAGHRSLRELGRSAIQVNAP